MMWKHIRCFSLSFFAAATVAATRQSTLDTLSCTPHERERERDRVNARNMVPYAADCAVSVRVSLALRLPSHTWIIAYMQKHFHVNQQPFRASGWRERWVLCPERVPQHRNQRTNYVILARTRTPTPTQNPDMMITRLCIGEKYERDSNMAFYDWMRSVCISLRVCNVYSAIHAWFSLTHNIRNEQASGKNWARMWRQRNLISFGRKWLDIWIDIPLAVPNLSSQNDFSSNSSQTVGAKQHKKSISK